MPPEPAMATQRAVSLADFTSETMIVPELRGRDTSAVIHELSKTLEQDACVPGMLPVYQSALNREYLVSTATDCGIAFPHARLTSVDRICFAFGRSRDAIAWGNGHSAHIVFLLAVPATEAAEYLSLLATLTRLGKNQALRDELLAARGASEIYSILRTVQLTSNRAPLVAADRQ